MFVVELLRARPMPRVIALTLIAVAAAGCSSESTRFNDNPFSSRASTDPTGSIPPAQAAPTGRVEHQTLTRSSLPPPTRPATVATTGSSYGPATSPTPDYTGSVLDQPAPRAVASGHWSWDGGTPVTVAQGDTLDAIAQRHGVPASAIMRANNLASPTMIQPGQRLVIPRYISSGAPAQRGVQPVASYPTSVPAHGPASVRAPAAANNPGMHVVAPGETLIKIARLYGKSLNDIARANNIPPHTKLNIGDRLVIPGVRTSALQRKTVPAPAVVQVKQQTQPASTVARNAPAAPAQSAAVVSPAIEQPAQAAQPKVSDATPTFRWPARGRVITGFGPKPNGQQNDGINLALPEGTQVKAAEDGVVAYAGNELKGYGNLVLVRHSNGYVTAYAHAKELMVKRGDAIKRGQVIATSGQTGNVDAPQLHFEIRKGPAPVDPMPLLNGG